MSGLVRIETFDMHGACVYAQIIDLDGNRYQEERRGQLVLDRELTLEERRAYGPQPLAPAGALAALLAVEGVLAVEDAANAVGVTTNALETEALAWGYAAATVVPELAPEVAGEPAP
jgi:hypothetical protein